MVMRTLQIRLPKKLLDEIEKLVESKLYQSRSDVIRDAVRRLITRQMLLEQQIPIKNPKDLERKEQEHYIH